MKINYIKTLPLLFTAAVLGGCSENAWNDHLDGFKEDNHQSFGSSVNVSYTLVKADFDTISNRLKAIATTDEEIAAANAIKNNQYFDQSSPYPAQVAIPMLLNKTGNDFFIYNNGSTVDISFTQVDGVPEEVNKISAAKTIKVDLGTPASDIPGIIKEQFPNAQAGDYVIVSEEAFVETPQGPWSVEYTLSRMDDGYEGEATVKGIISSISDISTSYGNATYFIKDNLSDERALEVYRGYYLDNQKFTSEDQLEVGATVVVTGKLVDYNGTFEFTSGSYLTSYEAPATRAHKTRAANLTSNIKNLSSGQELTATAVVTAQSGRGLILTDNAGSIFYYNNNVDLETYTIGTVVNVAGTVSVYGTGYQLPDSATLEVVGSETYTYPTPTTYTAEMIEAAIANTTPNTATYITYQGTLSISGTYYNINISGVSNGQGSLYTPTDDLLEEIANGNTYNFTGYYTGVTNSKYFYMVLTGAELVSEGTGGGNTGGGNTGGGNNGGGNTGGGNTGGGSTGGGNTGGSTSTPAGPVNYIYTYNGSSWVVPANATVLDPSDYSAMGFNNNKLSDPSTYLPLYMKDAFPYALPGAEMFVAYNLESSSCACALLLYDGSSWQMNNNYMEEVVAQFAKAGGVWSFRKYLGEEVYMPFKGDKIQLNSGYLLVADNYCAGPVVPTSGYFNYSYPVDITINPEDQSIVLENSDNTFQFLTEVEYNGQTYRTPEGKFVIRQSDGAYLYLGNPSYYNFGIRENNPYINNDGTISDAYLWGAEKMESGLWMIYCDYYYQGGEELTHKVIYYADSYSNFANYTDDQLSTHPDAVLLQLYISLENYEDDTNVVE